ncbi:uncharacterized protein LOC133779754 [Humulus lupulus]|uniref:uncharacterized protein LOC133779754 n=1 Tax=Humulus lupulus TaxID=3486 RepID=UPI002B40C2C8|nr:uncharacterized protein LOC133779754 [Humulus lupulus]
MTWAEFQAFSKKYYSAAVLATKVDEFVTLVQGNLYVTDYAQKFNRLAKFSPEVVPTEALREAYRNKGSNEGNKRKANEGQNSGIDKRLRPPATNNNSYNTQNHPNNRNFRYNDRNHGNHQSNKVEHPTCPKCSKRYLGEFQAGTNKCFKCVQVGHLRKDFPQWKVGHNNNINLVPAQIFALTRNEAANSNTIFIGQLSITGMMCRVLIDSGVAHSYVSMNMIDKLGMPCKLVEHSFSTMLPSGDMMMSTRWLQSAPITIERRECLADLIEPR